MFRLRDLKTAKIGKLLSIKGTVTRTTEVRPELILGSFRCMNCNAMIYDVQQNFIFTEPKRCSNPGCDNRIKWKHLKEESTFSDWQKVRVQENSSDIPTGSMPRSIDVVLRNEIVDSAKPGDRVFLPEL